MKEWSDEELDGLFRKSFEEFDPPFEPNDWNDLRNRLDAADNVPVVGGWIRKKWPLALLLLIMIGGIGYYYGTKEGKVGEKWDVLLPVPVKSSLDQSAQKQIMVSPENPRPMAEANPGINEIETQVPDNTGAPIQADRLSETRQQVLAKETRELPLNLASVSGVRRQTNFSERESGEGAVFSSKKSKSNFSNLGGILLDSNALSPSDRGFAGNSESKLLPVIAQGESGEQLTTTLEEGISTSLPSPESLAPHGPRFPSMNIQLPAVTAPITGVGDIPKSSSEWKMPAWAIRIGVAPDLSTVNMRMKGFDQPGPSASLLVERSLSKRLMVQTGVVRSLKTYRAQAGEYTWPTGWYQSQMPTSIDGACRVFEVPVNMRFDFVQREQNRWFAGAGVSSYKMQNEKYTYNYKSYDPNIRWWKWEGKTGWYLFSHLNASVGYERRISQRLSMVVEPHVRVPLRKVGFGKVNLFTTGVWASLRYSPSFRK